MARRGYEAAELTRTSEDWNRTPAAPMQDVRDAWEAMLARARELYNNSAHVKGFVHHRLPAQVLGAEGVRILPQVRRGGRSSGLNGTANDRIADAWHRWCERGTCTMDGEQSFADVQRTVLEAIVRDGECLIQFVRGRTARNPFFFAVQVLEAEHLDPTYDDRMLDGRLVIMGKEVDEWRRAIAYHVRKANPHDLSFTFRSYQRERLEARTVLHPFVRMYPGQIRGISWLHAAGGDARMLAKYREAELIAARIAASKAAVLEQVDELAAPLLGHREIEEKNEAGEVVRKGYAHEETIEPGQIVAAPPGYKWNMVDPTHPNDVFPAFEKAILRGMASSLGASYHGFSNDLEGVNYSSARMGAIDEREVWRHLQRWFIDHVVRPVFREWYLMAILGEELRLPPQITERVFRGVKWQPRGYSWVDPAKEATAAKLELELGLTTRTRILHGRGQDFQEVAEELAAEDALLAELGVGQTPPSEDPPDDEDSDAKPDDDDGKDDPDDDDSDE